MHYLVKYLEKLLKMKEQKGWEFLYFMIDIHNTVIRPTYNKSVNFEYFSHSKEVLQILSKRSDIKLIMWTSTYPEIITMYNRKFRGDDIIFDYINENPDFNDDNQRCFIDKFYYDVGIDDKFGFDAETGWKDIYDYLKGIGW